MDAIKISPSLEPYGYRTEWSDNDKELIIKPNSALAYDEEHIVSFIGAEDKDGNSLEDPSIRFKTKSAPGIGETITGMFGSMWRGFLDIVPRLILSF